TVKQLKLRVGLIVFQYLRVSFFPDTFFTSFDSSYHPSFHKYDPHIFQDEGRASQLKLLFHVL
ncbi:hypothetical protein, partial [Lactobacillus gallinarum]|uniref:hypothetical protein n=1 Tax=Lactobacillus gallinarum TaxID=52242 RepID=UPI003C6D41B4